MEGAGNGACVRLETDLSPTRAGKLAQRKRVRWSSGVHASARVCVCVCVCWGGGRVGVGGIGV